MFYKKKSITGLSTVDSEIDRIYKILNRIEGGRVSSTSNTTGYPITDEGGFYVPGINGMGYKLPKGYLVKTSASSDSVFITAPEDYYNVIGAIYDDTQPGELCKVVVSGIAYVYFNSEGATRDNYFRMSKSDDTSSTDHGKAMSESVDEPDSIYIKGWVSETRSGEGLAKCIFIR